MSDRFLSAPDFVIATTRDVLVHQIRFPSSLDAIADPPLVVLSPDPDSGSDLFCITFRPVPPRRWSWCACSRFAILWKDL